MKFEEALIWLREGEKIHSTEWNEGGYIELMDGEIIQEDNTIYEFCGNDLIGDVWQLYEEKKEEIELPISSLFQRLKAVEEKIKESRWNNSGFNELRNHVYERLNVVEKLVRDQSIGTQNVYQEFLSLKGQMEVLSSLINSPHKNELLDLYKKFQKLKELKDDKEWGIEGNP